MLYLLFNGQVDYFIIILIAIVISLTFHEFGHALVAKLYGDRTAELAGRLTLNPVAHIDPAGLLMVMIVGFGYAKPVPTNPRHFTSRWGSPAVAFAGPGMNLLLAFITINVYAFGIDSGSDFFTGAGQRIFFESLAAINLLLMLFNLIPLGPLDGHYILAHFLPPKTSYQYLQWNERYGTMILLSLIVLSILGLPIFGVLMRIAGAMLSVITFVAQ